MTPGQLDALGTTGEMLPVLERRHGAVRLSCAPTREDDHMRVHTVMLIGLAVSIGLGCEIPSLGAGSGCSKDADCKGDRVCISGQCTAPAPAKGREAEPAQPGAPAPLAAPARKPRPASREVTKRYTCQQETPGTVRGGCLCGNQIVNLCKCYPGIPCSPSFTIEGNTCVFQCLE